MSASNAAPVASSSSGIPTEEKSSETAYQVIVPDNNEKKRYSILQFNGPLRVNPLQWAQMEVKMAREDNRSQTTGASSVVQEYGEGSEYGKAAREELRRKKYGRQLRVYQHDNQPWHLEIKDPSGKERPFRSVREGGAGEHSDYWVFLKAGNAFHAHKVDDWYRFMPNPQRKTLDIDQAEEQFQHRNKVLNQFALKAKIQQTLKDMDEDGGKVSKPTTLKIKDDASSDDDDDPDASRDERRVDDTDVAPNQKKKGKKSDREVKDKRQRVKNADEVAAYESDDGDDDGREFDYISDSGSESDREELKVDEKIDKEMVGVDEEGADKDNESDVSDEENEEDDEREKSKKKLMKKLRGQGEDADTSTEDPLIKGTSQGNIFEQVDERDSSGSDTDDDPDNPQSKTSVFFMQRRDRKRPADDTSAGDDSTADVESKRPKTESRENTPQQSGSAATSQQQDLEDRLDEPTIRRLLQRKAHTTKELLARIRPHCSDMSKGEIVQRLAEILRVIEPRQFRQQINKKDVLFFSLSTNDNV